MPADNTAEFPAVLPANSAADFAKDVIRLILQHQPTAFAASQSPLSNIANAKQAAQAIATFRQELIAQLTKKAP